ncbi:MAG: hypothetical protein U0K87_08350 [Ruminococcus sp.]|nr:hypothetical protein [Ruminococcus sp.]
MSSKWFKEDFRLISPCVARIKSSQSYLTKPNKAHTGDLSRFVSRVSVNNKSAAD